MKLSKGGVPSITREHWLQAHEQHKQLSSSLTWLCARSLDSFLGKASDDEFEQSYQKADHHLKRLMMIWLMSEARQEQRSSQQEWSPESAYKVLIECLMKWASEESKYAEITRELANKVKPGRPKSTRTSFSNALLGHVARPVPKPPAKRRGRKSDVNISDENLLLMLSKNRELGRKDIDTLRVFVMRHLEDQGRHTAGGSVDRIAKNLQKRAAAARKVVHK